MQAGVVLTSMKLDSSRELPLSPNAASRGGDAIYYHEAQLSLLIFGVDEWLWTAYCCPDTYFGSEKYAEEDFDDGNGADPNAGGAVMIEQPVWNPREYYLMLLQRRMSQATHEWTELVNAFTERMDQFVRLEIFSYFINNLF